MITTFGLGPLATRHFYPFGKGNSAENVGKSQGKCEKNASRKKAVFGPFWGPWWTISRQYGVRFLIFSHNVSYFFYFPTLWSPCFVACFFFKKQCLSPVRVLQQIQHTPQAAHNRRNTQQQTAHNTHNAQQTDSTHNTQHTCTPYRFHLQLCTWWFIVSCWPPKMLTLVWCPLWPRWRLFPTSPSLSEAVWQGCPLPTQCWKTVVACFSWQTHVRYSEGWSEETWARQGLVRKQWCRCGVVAGQAQSVLSKSTSVNTRQEVNSAWEGRSQGQLWRRLLSISTGKSFVAGFGAKDKPNHLTAGSLRSFRQQLYLVKAPGWTNRQRVALDLFSNFKCVRFFRLHVLTPRGPSHCKQKSDDKGWT